MSSLLDQVRTFLEAEGFTVGQRRELLVGTRRTIGEDTEYINVWVPDAYDPTTFGSRETGFLKRFNEAAESNPSAMKFMVVPTLEGPSRAFGEGARQWYRVNIRLPVQFFDTNFKWDFSREAPSAAKDLRDRGEEHRRTRVPQPFVSEDTGESGPDLFDVIRSKLTSAEATEKSIHIVIGPGGIGKSHLFEVLFADLHRSFMDYKTRGRVSSPRPLPLIPEYLPAADGQTVRSLLQAYLQTDFARPLRAPVFEWMVLNRFAVWMLDGLDEIIARDPQFFDYLVGLMRSPSAPLRPMVLLCVRDSLLATNPAFNDFSQEYSGDVAVYRLSKWDTQSKRTFAGIRLGSSSEPFLAELRDRPSLNELASVPYYCGLLCEEFAEGRLRKEYSEASLLQHALASFIERDYVKGFIKRDLVTPEEVESFLEAVAAEDFSAGFRGIPAESVQDWARMILPAGMADDDIQSVSAEMTNLGVFGQSSRVSSPGYVRFAQEILEQYLLGRHLVRLLEQSPEVFLREVAQRELASDSLVLRLVADNFKSRGASYSFKSLVYQAMDRRAAFKNVLQLAALAAAEPSALRDVALERQDLSGLRFEGLDFSRMSLRGSNLSDTEFRRCNLMGVDFDEAILKNTGFLELPTEGLRDAKVGDLSKFFSVRVERGRMIMDYEQARAWFQHQTGQRPPIVSPCAAALQLRHLFNKFVYADGTARRSWLDPNAVTSGRRFHEAPERVVEAAARHGYLREEERFRDRLHRPEGDLYAELIGFATSLVLTPGIRAVLDEVCERESCVHVPKLLQTEGDQQASA